MTRPLVRAVFAVLVVATIAAFFLTQQLKGDFPLVIRFATKPAHFSPNGDGYRDETRIGFDLSRPANVSFMVVDAEGAEVRRIVTARRLAGDAKHRFSWNGRDDDGDVVPDGTYRMRVVRRDESRVIDSQKKITVDRVPPRVRIVSAEPSVIATGLPGEPQSVRLRYDGPKNRAPVVRVFRTDDGPPHIVRRFRGRPDRTATWDGRVSAGAEQTDPAPEGDYAFTIAVRDRAGNVTEAPRPRPRAAVALPGTGVSVRDFTLRGPASAVPAGGLAHLEVGPVDRSFDFAVSRLGDPKPVLRGGRVGGRFRIHVPDTMRTGVYLVRVRAGDNRAVWPLAVAGLPPRSARGEARPLVVLPVLTWQGLNRVDDDADGFGDRLPFSESIRVDRPFAGGGTPPRFDAEVSPLLRWLDRERLPYDLSTDLALAARRRGTRRLAARERERLRRAHGADPHERRAAHGLRRQAGAVRGRVRLRGRVHGLRALLRPPGLRAQPERGRPRGGPPRVRRLRPGRRHRAARRYAAVGARAGGVGAQPRAAASDEAHMDAACGGTRVIPLPSCGA
jgi:hypothetical protein